MSFPNQYASSTAQYPAQPHGATSGVPTPGQASGINPTTTSHPGMPPPNMSNGQAASYGYANAAAMNWRTDLPQLAAGWAALDKLRDPAVLESEFGAIDARNQLMQALGISRKEVDNLRGADTDFRKRMATVEAMRNFASSANPDTATLDRTHPPFGLLDVLAMVDRQLVRTCDDFLVPILTLLVLRHAGAGARYDTAVMAQNSSGFANQGQEVKQADQAQYEASQAMRHAFVQESAGLQARYREHHAHHTPADSSHLPAPAQAALSRLANAYQLDMTLAQKSEIVTTLEAALGVPAENSDDVSQPLEQLLRWYENPARHAPPPPGVLLGLVIAVGWQDFQDPRCLRERRTVKLMLTGHPALPDALCAALLHYKPAKPATLSLMHTAAPPQSPADQAAPAAAQLRSLLAQTPNAGPRRLAQLIERAIALCGPIWLDRLQLGPVATGQMTAELQAIAASVEQRDAITAALTTLTDVMQQVVHNTNPLYRAFTLDLYRSLGVAASDASRATRLNTIFRAHPEVSPAQAKALAEQFAQRMTAHGYSEAQSNALRATARQLHAHWETAAPTRLQIGLAHDQSLDALIELQVAKLDRNPHADAPRLGVAPPSELLASLITHHGFTDEMLRKLDKDLGTYQLFGNSENRARIEATYRAVLNPAGGSMADIAMAPPIRKLSGAITTHLASAPPSISIEVASVFKAPDVSALPPAQLLQLLRYFWRMDATLPNDGPVAPLREQLDMAKNARCISSDGQLDIARACEFNNAARENIVRLLTERVPGFGGAYATALDTTVGQPYDITLKTMQDMIDGWVMPERTY